MTATEQQNPRVPNFVRWCMERFGSEYSVSKNGNVTCEVFRAAKKLYETKIGCRVYSQEYEAVFYPRWRS